MNSLGAARLAGGELEPMARSGLYVQIPFCASKCTFCNFSSRVEPESVFDGYCEAVVREVETHSTFLRAAGTREEFLAGPVDTIYFGGGTPAIVGIERLGAIVAAVRRYFQVLSPSEFTLEATPGSLDPAALRTLLGLGVNRLSIGAQSFVDQELQSVGRLHTAQETVDLVAAAREARFRNISLDLIAGLPHQTDDSWRHSLEAVARIRPEHVSIYIFEIDEKSRLGAEVLKHGTLVHAHAVPDEDFAAEAYETGRRFLKGLGYVQYEISNLALPGFESRHNLKYWQLDPYLGLGAGAHSFDGAHRWSNWVSPTEYEAKVARGEPAVEDFHQVSRDELIEEFFFTGLRQTAGVDLAGAGRRWSPAELIRWQPAIDSLARRGLLERRGDSIRLADSAYLISNEVFQEFLAAPEEVRET